MLNVPRKRQTSSTQDTLLPHNYKSKSPRWQAPRESHTDSRAFQSIDDNFSATGVDASSDSLYFFNN